MLMLLISCGDEPIAAEPDASDVEAPECEPLDFQSFDLGWFPGTMPGNPTPVIMEGALLFQGYARRANRYQNTIYAIDLADESTRRLTYIHGQDFLLAAQNNRILISRYFADEEQGHFAIIDREGELIRRLEQASNGVISGGNFLLGDPAYPSFDGRRLVSIPENDVTQMVLTDIDTGHVRKVATGIQSMVSHPKLASYGVLFAGKTSLSASDNAQLLFLLDDSEQVFELTNGDEDIKNFAADNARIYWVTETGVYTREIPAGPAQKIHEAEGCFALDAADGMAVFGCREITEDSPEFPEAASTLYLYDGEQTLNILPASSASFALYPRVSAVGAVWMQVNELDEIAFGSLYFFEQINYYDIATQKQLTLGEVPAPCVACMISQMPILRIQDNMVAWTLNETSYQGINSSMRIAYALISPETHCDD